MSKLDHQDYHIKLHKSLDELLTDFYKATQKPFETTPIMELLSWSFEQTLNPVKTPANLIYEN